MEYLLDRSVRTRKCHIHLCPNYTCVGLASTLACPSQFHGRNNKTKPVVNCNYSTWYNSQLCRSTIGKQPEVCAPLRPISPVVLFNITWIRSRECINTPPIDGFNKGVHAGLDEKWCLWPVTFPVQPWGEVIHFLQCSRNGLLSTTIPIVAPRILAAFLSWH